MFTSLLYNTWQQEKPSTRVVLKNGLKLRKFLFYIMMRQSIAQ